jgi:hypothetical protein
MRRSLENSIPSLLDGDGRPLVAEPSAQMEFSILDPAGPPCVEALIRPRNAIERRSNHAVVFDARFEAIFSETVKYLLTASPIEVELNSNFDVILGTPSGMGAVGTLLEAKATLVRARGAAAEQLEIAEAKYRWMTFCNSLHTQLSDFGVAGTRPTSHPTTISPAQIFAVEAEPFDSLWLGARPEVSAYFHGVVDELEKAACAISSVVRAMAWELRDRVAIVGRAIQHRLYILFHFLSDVAMVFCSVSWPKRRWFLCHGARPPKSQVPGGFGPVFPGVFQVL